ncbi:unnamed protein product [Clonostachys rosea]|uniref:Aminoglycoside phosphotransferase domain-containing protein n=1 Tax=Bionectria ochroleuca TaxID=29856 RepID=A0ABY6V3G8_BIOOC|nr:unnamed protein product [Clonostachys rosea]
MVYCPMTPPIDFSIRRTTPDQWFLGTKKICEKVQDQESKPADALTSWEADGEIFYIRNKTPQDVPKGTDYLGPGPISHSGDTTAVWCIGQCFFKVNAWRGGMELEADNIRFVKLNARDVPVPDIIHEWIDHDTNRSFLITKPISGRTLEEEWPTLAPMLREQVAGEVAKHVIELASLETDTFRTATGCGVVEPWFLDRPRADHPSWLPRSLGPWKGEEMRGYMLRISNEEPPEIDNVFHFYHADLGPKNIIIKEDGSLSGIIGWESAAYYPSFWVATKTSLKNFHLDCDKDYPNQWGDMLRSELEKNHFLQEDRTFRRWKNGML